MPVNQKRNPLVGKVGFLLFLGALATLLYTTNSYSSPRVFLWAWERPENFLFLEDSTIGVALYAGSIELTDSDFQLRRRMQPIVLRPYTPVVPVVRIDNLRKERNIGDAEIQKIAEFIIEICTFKEVGSCQIDFEPLVSEREAYKNILESVKKQLPKSISLSITALVSYCDQNSWLEELPVDEVVPMFYGLGADEEIIRNRLKNNSLAQGKICQRTIGISTDEPTPPSKYTTGKNLYIFNPRSWNENEFSAIMTIIKNP